jgi:enamine deaminase RidA (YjgF/YER057c/UK114 family)
MPVELRNLSGRPEPQGFSHFSIASGDRLIHMAGQVGTDDQGEVAAGLAAQAEQALLNVGRVLEEAGASEADLVKLTVYVVDWDPSMFAELGPGLLAAREKRPSPDVPLTLIGVQSLFQPDMLVEIEGVALVSATSAAAA